MRYACLLALLLPTLVQAQAPSSLLGQREAARARIQRLEAEATSGRTLADVVARHLADDALVLLDGPGVVEGREAALAALRALPIGQREVRLRRWAATGGANDGRSGYSVGYLYLTAGASSGGETPSAAGVKWSAFWAPDANGEPRIRALALIPMPAGEAAPDETPLTDAAGADPALPASPLGSAAAAEAAAETDRAFAARGQEDLGGAFAEYAAPDGIVAGPGPLVVRGRDAIRRGFPPDAAGSLQWAPVYQSAAPSGDLAFTIGEATFRLPSGATRDSRYLSIWRRQADGSWRYVVDGGVGVTS